MGKYLSALVIHGGMAGSLYMWQTTGNTGFKNVFLGLTAMLTVFVYIVIGIGALTLWAGKLGDKVKKSEGPIWELYTKLAALAVVCACIWYGFIFLGLAYATGTLGAMVVIAMTRDVIARNAYYRELREAALKGQK